MIRTTMPQRLVRQARQPIVKIPYEKLCRYCCAELRNGHICCDEQCEDGWFRIVPIPDGSLYGERERSKPDRYCEVYTRNWWIYFMRQIKRREMREKQARLG
jgi:hypothetical protein